MSLKFKCRAMSKRCLVIVVVSLGLLFGGLAGCSTDDSNNDRDPNPVMEVNLHNISKKWTAAHFNFSSTANDYKLEKSLLQKSVFIISLLKEGGLEGINNYDLEKYKGSFELEAGVIKVELEDGSIYKFKVSELRRRTMLLKPIDSAIVESIELVTP
ncbi:hypothetical protein ACYSNM_05695 [Myroides sp. LJL116]